MREQLVDVSRVGGSIEMPMLPSTDSRSPSMETGIAQGESSTVRRWLGVLGGVMCEQEDGELVAAEPGDVSSRRTGRAAAGGGDQQPVAGWRARACR